MIRTRSAAPALIALSLVACGDTAVEPAAIPDPAFLSRHAEYSGWSLAQNIEASVPGADPEFNSPSLDGCPFISPDGKTFFMASGREGGEGGLDIWISTRASTDDPWGPPVNAGEPINSPANDFCPTLDRDGHTFYFVSNRTIEGVSCGGGDIYVTRFRADGAVDEPVNLGCDVNSAFDEAGPFPLREPGSGPVLYFSSTRPGLGTGGDLYRSESHGGDFGMPELVPGVNSAVDDGQPNLRRDGLELYFYSTRAAPGAQGGPDIYVATRASTSEPWSTPVNLGPNVNTAAGETRPSLSWDATELYFGSNRPASEMGSADIYVSRRTNLGPAD